MLKAGKWLIISVLVIMVILVSACGGELIPETGLPGTDESPSDTCGEISDSTVSYSLQKQNLSDLIKSLAPDQDISGFKLVEAFKALPRVTATDLPSGFDDSDDFWPLLLTLSAADQAEMGIELPGQLACTESVSPGFPEATKQGSSLYM